MARLRFVVIAAVIAGAILWSVRHREARLHRNESAELDAALDQLNHERTRNLQASLQGRLSRHDDVPADATLPPGLTVDAAAALIDRCRGFAEVTEVRLPNGYFARARSEARAKYPELEDAEDHLLETEDQDGFIKLTVKDASALRVTDHHDEFGISLGRRDITSMHSLTGTADGAQATFTWQWSERVAAEGLRPGASGGKGEASFSHRGSWSLASASVDGQAICP